MTEFIATYWPMLVSVLPSITAVLTCIGFCIKWLSDNKNIINPLVKKFNELEGEVKNQKNYDEVKAQMACLVEQNAKNTKMLKKIYSEQTKVVLHDEEQI